MKTAIVYARVSTMDQSDDGLPIAGQIEASRNKAADLDASVVRVFVDEGISGRNLSRRAFKQAFDFCEANPVDYFICWNSARFARNYIEAGLRKAILKKLRTRLVYVSMDIDRETDGGWFLDAITDVTDEFNCRRIAQDTRRSMDKNARDGFFNGGVPPFGYEAVPCQKRRRLSPVAFEAATVRDIFRWHLSGDGAKTIAMRLNQQGRWKRGRKWEKNHVARVLKNRVYLGEIVFNRKIGCALRPESEWIVTPAHEAIMDAADFAEAQQLTARRVHKSNAGSSKSTLVFTGILRCGSCGAAMQAETATGRSARYHYYNCRAVLKGIGCRNRRVRARAMDDWLLDKILDTLLTDEALLAAVNSINRRARRMRRERDARLIAYKAELQAVERRMGRIFEIFEAYGKNTPDLGGLTNRLREHKLHTDQIKTSIDRLLIDEPQAVDPGKIDCRGMARRLRSTLRAMPDARKMRAFLSNLVEKITLKDDVVQIEYQPERLVHSNGSHWLPE